MSLPGGEIERQRYSLVQQEEENTALHHGKAFEEMSSAQNERTLETKMADEDHSYYELHLCSEGDPVVAMSTPSRGVENQMFESSGEQKEQNVDQNTEGIESDLDVLQQVERRFSMERSTEGEEDPYSELHFCDEDKRNTESQPDTRSRRGHRDYAENEIYIEVDQTERENFWDLAPNTDSQKPKSKGHTYPRCNKFFRLLTIITVLLGLLVCTVISKTTLLLASSQLQPNLRLLCVTSPEVNTTSCVAAPVAAPVAGVGDTGLYCLGKEETGQDAVRRDVCEAVSVRWAWCLILMMCTPYVLVALRCIYYLCFISKVSTSLRAAFFVMIQETAYCTGVSIFVFRVLPHMDDVIQGLALMSGVGFLPGLLRMLIRPMDRKWWGIILSLDIIAFLSQVSAVILLPVLASTTYCGYDSDLVWSGPTSLVLMSVCWWENYVTEDTKLCGPFLNWLKKIKKEIKESRYILSLAASILKIVWTILMAMLIYSEDPTTSLFNWGWSSSRCGDSVGPLEVPSMEWDWLYVWALNSLVGFVGYFFARTAAKVKIQLVSYVIPMLLTMPAVLTSLVGMCESWNNDPCVHAATIPGHLFWQCYPRGGLSGLVTEPHLWLMFVWSVSQVWISRHIFYPSSQRLIKTERLFNLPLYDNIVLSEWLMYNRSRKDKYEKQKEEYCGLTSRSKNSKIPFIHVCATMWHESRREMETLLHSLYRLDKDHADKKRSTDAVDKYDLQINIYVDDAIKYEKRQTMETTTYSSVLNAYVKQLVTLVKEVSHTHGQTAGLPRRYHTPYGGRLVWDMPHGTRMVVHLKDKRRIRAKKRWSQVMYMYELVNFTNSAIFEGERRLVKADDIFLLALDGDVDFKPEAVLRLLDKITKNEKTAAVCGRIHPLGSGPMMWYQQFEYALGHWMQKSTEHVLGCVLCSPGCFSLFRGSALREVMHIYTQLATEARHYIQYDQGEDRWLNTLLLKQGHNVEYSAASDSFTYVPEMLPEFFKQRRRWMPSTMANILDLLMNAKQLVRSENDITRPYIWYQAMLFALSLVGGGTIFLMIVGALQVALDGAIDKWTSLVVNSVPVLLYGLVCFKGSPKIQAMCSVVLTVLYALMQALVLVGIIVQISKDGICSPTGSFFFFVAGVFLLAACIHPQEFGCIIHGITYFLAIPSMYMLLTMYSIINLNVMSWGTREDTPAVDNTKHQESPERETQRDWTLQIGKSCTFLCCPHPDRSEHYDALLREIKELRNIRTIQNPSPTADDEVDAAVPFTSSRDLINGGHQWNVYDQRQWISEKCLDDCGEIQSLDQEETQFFEKVIEKYLKPLEDNAANDEKMAKQLLQLRNVVATGYFLVNAIFVIVIFTLQSNVEDVSVAWPCGQNLRLEPIGFTFLMCFGVIMLIQTCGMILHRTSTFLHIVASTSLIPSTTETKPRKPDLPERHLRRPSSCVSG